MSGQTAEAPGAELPGRRELALLFTALITTMLLASLNNTLLASATPTIVGELHSVELIGWVVTAYFLSSTIAMPIYGKISDQIGRRPVLLVAIVIFVAGSVTGALAQDVVVLIAARAIQGLGGGGLIILSQAAIADVVPPRQRGQYMGVMGSMFAFSSVAGPFLGGWLTDGPGWRWVFWINLPLGALAFIGVTFLLRLPRRHPARLRLDLWGMTLLTVATTALVLLITWAGTALPWTSPFVLVLLAALVLSAVAFVLVELRVAEPVLPLAMLRTRNFRLTTIAAIASGVAMFGVLGYMPTYVQVATGLGATISGLLMAPMMAVMMVSGIIAGRIVTATGRYRWAPITGMVALAVGLLLLGTVRPDAPHWYIGVALGIIGLGLGFGMQMLTLIVQNEFPVAMVGTATAANNFFRQIGATVGSGAVGTVFANRLHEEFLAQVPATGATSDGAASLTPDIIWQLPESLRHTVIAVYNDALMPIFLGILPVIAIGLVAVLLIREKPLATTIERTVDTEAALPHPPLANQGRASRHGT